MTGEKNRGVSLEKLWKLDDETLTTPEHDRLVMLFFDVDFKRKFVSFIERGSNDVVITGVSVKDLEYRTVAKNRDGFFVPAFIPCENNYSIADSTARKHQTKHCPYPKKVLEHLCPKEPVECNAESINRRDAITQEWQRLWEIYSACHYTTWKLKNETDIIQKRIDMIPVIKQQLISSIKTADILDWYTVDIQSEVPIVTGGNKFIVGYWDIIVTITPKHRTKDHIEYQRATTAKRLFIEAKPVIDSFGKVLRQLNTYREHQKMGASDYIVLFTEDVTFQSAFENQGVPVIHPSDVLS
jgi:hypothetical protein